MSLINEILLCALMLTWAVLGVLFSLLVFSFLSLSFFQRLLRALDVLMGNVYHNLGEKVSEEGDDPFLFQQERWKVRVKEMEKEYGDWESGVLNAEDRELLKEAEQKRRSQ